ncbi:MAG: BLUF domain-containing protein, partial [Fibrobacterota bacterium]|nr:BLUF domain-containing protein [Fibrobacterota bacterium]
MNSETKEINLAHCIYASAATVEFSNLDISTLLEISRTNNSKLGVTGILLHDSGSFFQVLEGEPEVITSLYEKIGKDKRHNRVSKIIFESIESR